MRQGQIRNVRRAYADISELTFEGIEFELPISEDDVFIDRSAHEAIRQAGVEQQNALRVDYEEARHRHVGVRDLVAREVVVLRAIEYERAAVDHVQPRGGDSGQGRASGSACGAGGPPQGR